MSEEPMRFRLRVRYQKVGRLAYLGHLEVMRTIERTVRRAGLPYAVTQGFSPRMKAGYTSALPVGTSSTCEWFDVFLTGLVPAPAALARLQAAAPHDLMPDLAGYIDPRTPALTAQITRVRYDVELIAAPGASLDAARVREALSEVRAQGQIAYRRGKKAKELDVAGLLVDASVVPVAGEPGAVALDLDTRTTNDGALRPEILLVALDRILRGAGAPEEPIESTGQPVYGCFSAARICRTGQFIEREDGTLTPPLGEEPSAFEAPRVAALGMV